MSYLINTNVVSEIVKTKPDKKVINWFNSIPNEGLFLSVLTLGEIRKGIEKINDEKKQNRLRLWLEYDLPAWFNERILPINLPVVDRWGRLQAKINRPIPAIDSLIAATALHHDLCLVTRNVIDFDYLPALEIVNPWSI